MLRNGEPAFVAGAITRTDQNAMNGIPGMGTLPGLNRVTTSNSKDIDEDELLVVITPHILSENEAESSEVVLPR
jgi:general secretion pathway protein D